MYQVLGAQTRHINQAHKLGTTSAIAGHVYVYVYTSILKPGIDTRHGVFYVYLNQAHK